MLCMDVTLTPSFNSVQFDSKLPWMQTSLWSLKGMAVCNVALQMGKDVKMFMHAATKTSMEPCSAQPAQLNQLANQTKISQGKPSTNGSLNPPCLLEMCPSFAITDNQRLATLSSMVDSLGDNCTLTLQSSLMLTQTVQEPPFVTCLILLGQRTPHSLMHANMLSMPKWPSSRPQNIKS